MEIFKRRPAGTGEYVSVGKRGAEQDAARGSVYPRQQAQQSGREKREAGVDERKPPFFAVRRDETGTVSEEGQRRAKGASVTALPPPCSCAAPWQCRRGRGPPALAKCVQYGSLTTLWWRVDAWCGHEPPTQGGRLWEGRRPRSVAPSHLRHALLGPGRMGCFVPCHVFEFVFSVEIIGLVHRKMG